MENSEEIKQVVRDKYGKIALNSFSTSCGCGCTSNDDLYSIMKDEYKDIEGYVPEADLNLGCGLPTEFAMISKGDTVLDLGSGAGNDVFIARSLAGEEGYVIGVDMTVPMVAKARMNCTKLGYTNVEFRLGEIENLPVANDSVDVVISNCVLNLVPDKEKAFSEIYRVMKAGGHFSISDIVLKGTLPPKIQNAAEMYAGCVAGAMQFEDYIGITREKGFKNITIQKEKKIEMPEDTMLRFMTPDELAEFRESGASIISITVYGEK